MEAELTYPIGQPRPRMDKERVGHRGRALCCYSGDRCDDLDVRCLCVPPHSCLSFLISQADSEISWMFRHLHEPQLRPRRSHLRRQRATRDRSVLAPLLLVYPPTSFSFYSTPMDNPIIFPTLARPCHLGIYHPPPPSLSSSSHRSIPKPTPKQSQSLQRFVEILNKGEAITKVEQDMELTRFKKNCWNCCWYVCRPRRPHQVKGHWFS
jgi:hypothetical protein